MSTSMEIRLTEATFTKALHVQEVAMELFRNVVISVKPEAIVLSGDEYEEVLHCKHWFLMMTGIVLMPSRRRHNSKPSFADGARPNPDNDSLTSYITYEKISVKVMEGDMVGCNEKDFYFGKIDCFVNPTNSALVANSKVSKALQDAGGQSYKTLCEQARPVVSEMKVAECYVTGGGNIKCGHVMHAICPTKATFSFIESMQEEVFTTVFNCLKMAEKCSFRAIAIPFICTGQGRLDVRVCSEQYAFAVLEFGRLRNTASFPETIVFIDIDKAKVDQVNSVFEEILPKTTFELLEVPKLSDNESNTSSASISTTSTDTSSDSSDDISLSSTVDSLEIPRAPFGLALARFPEENDGNQICHSIEKYKLVLEVGYIRSARTTAIICPENINEPRGGLLAAAIKCRFRQSFDPRSMKKVEANAIATTEHKTASGGKQFVLHVPTRAWAKGSTPTDQEKSLKTAIQMTFDKLKRHRKRNIRSIAIPLMGTSSTENEEVVWSCCVWQVEKVIEILQREDIVNLEKVCLINRCEDIRNTLQASVKRTLGI